jgi:hypothetical protein
MTDPVNVPREARYGDETASQIVRRWAAWIIDASADMEQPEWGGKTDNDVRNERDFLIRSLLAAAPKVEQEPVLRVVVDPNVEGGKRFTIAAPASDELLEALEWFCDRVDRGEVRSKSTYACFKALLAKHKGPQS